jgi:transposase
MNFTIFVGLDVHKSSISACSIDIETGEKKKARFGYDVDSLCKWITDFKKPCKVVYESGFCGNHLYRELRERKIHCCIAAISKLTKPSGDKVKTDKRDAEFLARQLAARNISEVFVPSIEMEGYRDLVRVYESICEHLKRYRQYIDKFLLRYGIRYTLTKTQSTKTYFKWLKTVKLPTLQAQYAFNIDLSMLIHLMEEKQSLKNKIESLCKTDIFKQTVDSLCMLVGIRAVTAFRLICEIGSFTRFRTARGFASYLGLVPSEHSSGKTMQRGRITKCGNSHVRKLLVEIAWTYNRAKNTYKETTEYVDEKIIKHAQKGSRRLIYKRDELKVKGKSANIANVATARELSMWIWSIAVMNERAIA